MDKTMKALHLPSFIDIVLQMHLTNCASTDCFAQSNKPFLEREPTILWFCPIVMAVTGGDSNANTDGQTLLNDKYQAVEAFYGKTLLICSLIANNRPSCICNLCWWKFLWSWAKTSPRLSSLSSVGCISLLAVWHISLEQILTIRSHDHEKRGAFL